MAALVLGCTVDTSSLRAPQLDDASIAAEDAVAIVDVSNNSPDLLEIDHPTSEETSSDIGSHTIDGVGLDASPPNLDLPLATEEGSEVASGGADEPELDGGADTADDANVGTVADGPSVATEANGGGGSTGTGGALGGVGGSAGNDSRGSGGTGGEPIDTAAEGGAYLPDADAGFDGSDDVVSSGGTGGNLGNGGAGGMGGSGGSGGNAGAGGTAGGSGGNTGAGGTAGNGADPDLVLWYKFDESSGTVAADSSPSGTASSAATLGTVGTGGGATFSTDCKVGTHSLRLTTPPRGGTDSGGYVSTPAPASLLSGAATIAFWIKVAAAGPAQNWTRIFDFGSGTDTNIPYFYMTSRAADATSAAPRFGISIAGHVDSAEQRLEGKTALVANVWQHIAIVLPAGATYTGTLYVDGVAVDTNTAMTLHPSDVGVTTQNWIGRSPFTSDPMFSGWLDDFRIYRRALSADEITALIAVR